MFDYRGIEALYMVQELQSFELAAKKLHITQSAVSQRVKALESQYGEPVLIRTLPYKPTKLGQSLIAHYKKICLLEETLKQEMGAELAKPHISIALNRDSLEMWFLDLIEKTDIFKHITLEIIADDQERTFDYFKNGLVSACLSTSEKPAPGGKVSFLGTMDYLLVASPQFAKTHFSKELKKSLLTAPAIKFDQNDELHERYLEKYYGINGKDLDYHTVPSVKGFKKFVLLGYGYGLIPRIDIIDELKTKKLVQISEKVWKIPLYWHSWSIDSEFYCKFNNDIIKQGKILENSSD